MMRKSLIVLVGSLSILGSGRLSPAQPNPFYEAPDQVLAGQMKDWSAFLWAYKSSGVPAPGAAAFAYSNPLLNSPLFSPAVAATKTVAAIAASDDCVGRIDEGVITVDSTLGEKSKLYMTLGILETNLYTEPTELTAHLQAIMEAMTVADVQVWTDGATLKSSGVPAKLVEQLPSSPGVLTNPSDETWDHIVALAGASRDTAAAQNLSASPRRAILGQPSLAADFEGNIAGFLQSVRQSTAMTSRIEARFGRFGALPMVLVHFDDASVLIDTINGNVAGPFENGSPLDASSLLAAHAEYLSGTPVSYLNQTGCIVVAGPKWLPGLPTGPRVTTPYTPTPPRAPNLIPGNPGNWTCVSTGWILNPTCTCTTIEVWDSGTPLPPAPPGLNITVRVRHTCVFTGGYCGTSTSFPPTPANPTPPPAATLPTIPGPVPPGTLTPPTSCTPEFEIWS